MTASTRDEATEQARALGDPTRNAIFRYIDAASDPVGVAELTDHFGLNHNAIRQHLAKLRDAGLVVEELAAPSGPGRPPLRYRPNPGRQDGGRATAHTSSCPHCSSSCCRPETIREPSAAPRGVDWRRQRAAPPIACASSRRSPGGSASNPALSNGGAESMWCSTGARSSQPRRQRRRSSASSIAGWPRAWSSQDLAVPGCATSSSGRRSAPDVAS